MVGVQGEKEGGGGVFVCGDGEEKEGRSEGNGGNGEEKWKG